MDFLNNTGKFVLLFGIICCSIYMLASSVDYLDNTMRVEKNNTPNCHGGPLESAVIGGLIGWFLSFLVHLLIIWSGRRPDY